MNFILNSNQAIINNNDYLSKIVFKCLELDLNNRYHNVSEIKEDLSKGELA